VPLAPFAVANAGHKQPKAKARNDNTRCAVEYCVCEGEEIKAAKAKNNADSRSKFLPVLAVLRTEKDITKMRADWISIEDLTTHLTGESSALSSLSDCATLLYPGKK